MSCREMKSMSGGEMHCREEGMLCREEGNVRRWGGKSPSGKSVSSVPAPEGYLGGVVGESEAKRGYESPAPLQRIACGGHSGDSDLQEAEMD